MATRLKERSFTLTSFMNSSRETNTLLSPCERVRKLGIPNSEGRGWRKALGYSPAFQMRVAPYRRCRDVCLGWVWNVQYERVAVPHLWDCPMPDCPANGVRGC